jgi:RNA methyltransferase, TrmH family
MMDKLAASKGALIRDLVRHKKKRDAEGLFIVEGPKPIEELLASHATYFEALVVSETRLATADQLLADTFRRSGCRVYVCQGRVFATLSDLTTPSGMLAVVRQPVWDQQTVFRQPTLFGLYGECLQDPANVGPIIRTAVALGLDALWLSPDSVDVFNPKIVRASAGALLKLPIFYIGDVTLFATFNCAIFTAEVPSPQSHRIQDIGTRPPRVVIAFGNESRGLSASTIHQASLRFHIPICPQAESLNVAAAAAIAAFHFTGLPHDAPE